MIINTLFWNRRKNIHKSKIPYIIPWIVSFCFCIVSFTAVEFLEIFLPIFLVCCGIFLFCVYKIITFHGKWNHLPELLTEYQNLKKLTYQNYFSLQKQKFIINEIITIYNPKYWDSSQEKWIFHKEILGIIIDFEKEISELNARINNFQKTHKNDATFIFWQKISHVFEKIIIGNKEEKNFSELHEISEIIYFPLKRKSTFQGIILTLLVFLYGNILIINFEIFPVILLMEIITGYFIGKIIFQNKNNKNFSEIFSKKEHFHHIISLISSYFHIISPKKNIHYADALLFADLVKFLSENILERWKNLEKYEKFILSNYCYFYIFQFKIPKEIENFFINEKIKLWNDAILVKKIIAYWAEIEKNRLKNFEKNSDNPLILASNKRREIWIQNLENIITEIKNFSKI